MARVTKKTSETQQVAESVPQPVEAEQPVAAEPKQKKSRAKTTQPASQEQAPVQTEQPVVAEPKQKKSRAKSVEPTQQTDASVVQEKKKRSSKKQSSEQSETQEQVETQEQPETVEAEQVVTEKRSRKVVNQETLRSDLESLKQQVEDEIVRLRSSEQKNKGVKFLKNVNRSLKMLHSDLNKVLKSKVKTVRSKNTSSGFMKPVKISSEMALFTSWDSSKLYSRVDVTKFLCKYIKDNTLQNPEDRRQILCDPKLASLLKIDTATSAPLTYPGLQQYIQQHFIPVTEEAVVSEETVKP